MRKPNLMLLAIATLALAILLAGCSKTPALVYADRPAGIQEWQLVSVEPVKEGLLGWFDADYLTFCFMPSRNGRIEGSVQFCKVLHYREAYRIFHVQRFDELIGTTFPASTASSTDPVGDLARSRLISRSR